METTVFNAVSKFSDADLRHVRRTLEAELLAECAAGVKGTQAHAGKLEMLGAVSDVLLARRALVEPAPWVEVDREDGRRLSFSVRVF